LSEKQKIQSEIKELMAKQVESSEGGKGPQYEWQQPESKSEFSF